jgi:hypothetical protein
VADPYYSITLDQEPCGVGPTAARTAGIGVRAMNAQGMVRRVLDVSGVLELFDND